MLRIYILFSPNQNSLEQLTRKTKCKIKKLGIEMFEIEVS